MKSFLEALTARTALLGMLHLSVPRWLKAKSANAGTIDTPQSRVKPLSLFMFSLGAALTRV
ncbi:hypothetical protein P6166_07785 [Stenotrophomonas sp. HITSZ_GD]|uniref:hypothetical protein n=1 Tax=Stenotrophomonas sp. HITSZ_GD TaxID=3037248 RepID=UPI00240D052A|nr:hypothetical protein [Stenotrophomonas sp. HITSZ_GD]MDG2525251.1 hypothetical protein [Stenotrophomonas sp. HITSZ_GD]